MKNTLLTLTFVLSAFITVFGQQEGHFKYSVEITADRPEYEMMIGMMQGSTLEIFFKDQSTRTVMQMGPMMTITTVVNGSTDDQIVLMSGMMGNKVLSEDIYAEDTTIKAPSHEVKLVNETKQILDKTCKKAIVTDSLGNSFDVWYCEDVKINTEGQKYFNNGVPGFPMEFTILQNGMRMKATVTQFKEELPESEITLFSTEIPAGYQVMTKEEMIRMGGGM